MRRNIAKNNILIIVPPLDVQGGIANYYKSLKNKFSDNIEYLVRPKKKGINKLIGSIFFYIKLIRKLQNRSFKLIHVNTSLDFRSLLRDAVIIRLSIIFNKKSIIFFRGWHLEQEEKAKKYFIKIINKSDACIVLSNEFKLKLIKWGYNKEIYTETTTVDDFYLKGVLDTKIENKYINSSKKKINLLFYARVEKYKGIYEALITYKLLYKKYSNMQLIIIGGGSELHKAKKFVVQNNIRDVVFKGHLSGEEKYRELIKGDILLFPSYSEGMPNSILEAMAAGLSIVTTKVGGIKDFFIESKMGFSTESVEPDILKVLLEKLILDVNLRKAISLYNYNYAKENFYASKVAKRIEQIYNDVLNNGEIYS